MRKALIAAFAVSFIAGCSSIPMAQAPVEDNIDHQYVAAVQNAAKHFGTYVVWVNLPQKRTTTSTQ